ncbi:ribonuclease R [Acholeplasma granularum]|uniref:ribonuclease R n=1 Tax=Acholeplasma granularum TaxID=264635 RepID=UPI00046EEC8A|nr:ribonuclease R [Acholeplasma granularum]
MNKDFMKWYYDQRSPYITSQMIKEVYKEQSDKILLEVAPFFDMDSNDNLTLKKDYAIGKLTIKRTIAFLIVSETTKDIPIDLYELNGAMEGDIVLVKKYFDPFVVEIIESKLKKIIADVKITKDKKMRFDAVAADNKLIVVENIPDYLVDGHVILLNVIEVTRTKIITNFVQVIGHKNDPDMEIVKIVYDYEWPLTFSKEALDELHHIRVDKAYESKTRKDITDKFIVTIDGIDAKDLDDAISIEKLDSGNYKLGVHIADVSYFVKDGGFLDKDAYQRATSVYLADRVIPMIPHGLSNDLCSLNPHEDKYTITCEMELNQDIDVVSYNIYASIIESKRRLTYDEVNSLFKENQSTGLKKLDDMLYLMNEISQKLKMIRSQRGAIDFESSELKFKLDMDGNVLDIEERKTDAAEELIESFMILANETVAKHFHSNHLPGIYRVHEKPTIEKLEIALETTSKMGFKSDAKSKSTAQTLQKLTKKVSGTEYEYIINMILLRSMQKAKYSEKPIGHFGLASPYYSHFTSPIRRYPDLLLHRMIRDLILNHPSDEEFIKIKNHYENILPSYSEHTSSNERIAINMERDVNKLKSRQYMQNFINKSFEGQIVSMMPSGFFVKLTNGIEGFVNVRNINQYLIYDEQQLLFYTDHGNRYRLGDMIKVKLIKVDEIDNNIDFTIDQKNKAVKHEFKKVTKKPSYSAKPKKVHRKKVKR